MVTKIFECRSQACFLKSLPTVNFRRAGDVDYFHADRLEIWHLTAAQSAPPPGSIGLSNSATWTPIAVGLSGLSCEPLKTVFCSFCCCCFYADSCSATLDHIVNNTPSKNCAWTCCGSHTPASQNQQWRSFCASPSSRSQVLDCQFRLHTAP
jgi:hypothetical protein